VLFHTGCSDGCSVVQPLDLLEISDACSSVWWHRGTCLEDTIPSFSGYTRHLVGELCINLGASLLNLEVLH